MIFWWPLALAETPGRWLGIFDELMIRIGGRFRRVEPRRRARAFVLGLLAELPRKNCWTIAEHAGGLSPDGMPHLLTRAGWDADGVSDDVRDYVIGHLGDPDAVLVVDETGDRQPESRRRHPHGAPPTGVNQGRNPREPGQNPPGRSPAGIAPWGS